MAEGGEPALQLQGYGIAFGDRKILRHVDLSIPATGCTVLMGPSGTGKSSLLRTLAGYNDANPSLRTWGTALYRGAPLTAGNQPALLVQKAQLLVSTVLDNLLCYLPERASLTRAQQLEVVQQVALDLGQPWLMTVLEQAVINLSLGQQRIVAIVREWLSGAALLMLDEPTTALSDTEAEALLGLMEAAASRRALLVILHHLAQAQRLADQVVLLASGQTQEAAPKTQFFTAPQSLAAQQLLRTGSCAELATEYEGEDEDDESALPTVPALLPSARPGTTAASAAAAARSAAYGPRGFVWLLPGQVAGTPWPGVLRPVQEDLAALRAVGITVLVNLTEAPFDAHLAQQFCMRTVHFPILDMGAPELSSATALCQRIDQWLAEGAVVALHCRAGLGRTGTMLAAYLLWQSPPPVSAVRSIERVRSLEQQMIQSTDQTEFLARFADVITAQAGRALTP